MSSPGSHRGLVAVAGLLLAIGVAVAILVLQSSGSTHRSRPTVPLARTTAPAPPRPKPRPRLTDDPWPLYGYNLARTRFFPHRGKLGPPLHVGWKFNDGALLEFPPVLSDNTLYFVDAHGSAKALSTTTGRVLWARKIGSVAAASPA